MYIFSLCLINFYKEGILMFQWKKQANKKHVHIFLVLNNFLSRRNSHVPSCSVIRGVGCNVMVGICHNKGSSSHARLGYHRWHRILLLCLLNVRSKSSVVNSPCLLTLQKWSRPHCFTLQIFCLNHLGTLLNQCHDHQTLSTKTEIKIGSFVHICTPTSLSTPENKTPPLRRCSSGLWTWIP